MTAQSLCRDCGEQGFAAAICPACHSRRVLRHEELFALTIAHIDCDAFYASVEKRDAPELAAKPVIVGGGRRGVVAACCYIARTRGVRSAMPMFKALAACPDAVVLRPNMAKYAAEGARIRAMMQALTPLVEPMSIDEAVLDLSGTEALHRAPPAAVLAEFARRVEREAGVTISVGLAANRLLAKIAAGRDKPRGFAVIGRAEAAGLLAGEPVRLLPGVGAAMAAKLHAAGFTRLGQLAALDARDAARRFGEEGPGLAARARGEDNRPVVPGRETKSTPSKFLPFRQGPMLVEEKVGTKYTLRNLNTKKLKDFHVSLLREFIYDPEQTDPEAVAMTDAHLFEVERILSHKGTIKRKTGLTFKVKFVGDDVIYEEPWSNLRRNEVLHAYLRDNGLVTWIPPEFR